MGLASAAALSMPFFLIGQEPYSTFQAQLAPLALPVLTPPPPSIGLSFNAITTGLLKLNEEGCTGPKCYSKVFYFVVPMAGLCLVMNIVLTLLHVKKDREKNIQYV